MKNPLPQFASEEEERDFWAEHDSTDYVDWSRAERVVLPNLKASTTTISLSDVERPYQSLLKSFLADRLDEELRGPPRRKAS